MSGTERVYHTADEEALLALGRHLGEHAEAARLVVHLYGDLGAGKSVLARAIARGAGVAARMPSPTYNLMFRYSGAGGTDIVHLDLYRLEEPADVWALGWRELGRPGEIVLVTAAGSGVGSFAVQIARASGCTVVATAAAKKLAPLVPPAA